MIERKIGLKEKVARGLIAVSMLVGASPACKAEEKPIGNQTDNASAEATETGLDPLQTPTEIAPGINEIKEIIEVEEIKILTESEVMAEMDKVFRDFTIAGRKVSEVLTGFKNQEFSDAVRDSEFFKTDNIETEIVGIKVKDAEGKQDNMFLFIESTSPDEEGKGFMSYVQIDLEKGIGAASLERDEGLDGKAAMVIFKDPLTEEKLDEPFVIFQTINTTIEELDAMSELPEEEREEALDGVDMYLAIGSGDEWDEGNKISRDSGFQDYLTAYREPAPEPAPEPSPEVPELPEELQEMGLELKEGEDGKLTAVDEKGYTRFYLDEATGEWKINHFSIWHPEVSEPMLVHDALNLAAKDCQPLTFEEYDDPDFNIRYFEGLVEAFGDPDVVYTPSKRVGLKQWFGAPWRSDIDPKTFCLLFEIEINRESGTTETVLLYRRTDDVVIKMPLTFFHGW